MGAAGAGSGDLASYGMKRGFPTSAGFSLYNQEQGGDGILDVGETNWQPKLEAAIVKAMGSDPNNYPEYFGFTFDPTEFTEAPDKDVVEQMTFLGNYIAEHYPKTTILTINQGTHGKPTPFYGVRYFDLMKFAPANVGTKVHTLMFYDLFRPAPVLRQRKLQFPLQLHGLRIHQTAPGLFPGSGLVADLRYRRAALPADHHRGPRA